MAGNKVSLSRNKGGQIPETVSQVSVLQFPGHLGLWVLSYESPSPSVSLKRGWWVMVLILVGNRTWGSDEAGIGSHSYCVIALMCLTVCLLVC